MMTDKPVGREIPDAYKFCPRCGGGLARTGPARMACQQCQCAHYVNPICAVGTVVEAPDGRIVVIRRAKDPGRGLLAIPGGFVDINESAEDAAIREAREEVGIEVGHLRYLTSTPNRYHYEGLIYPVLDVYYVGRPVSLDALRPLDDVADVFLADPRSIDPATLAFDATRHAIATYMRLLDVPGPKR